MKAYSKDLRIRVLDATDRDMPHAEAAIVFGVSAPTITRWRRRRRETGSVAASPRLGRTGVKLPLLRVSLPARLDTHPDALLEEHCAWFIETTGLSIHHTTISRAIRELKWTRKKSH